MEGSAVCSAVLLSQEGGYHSYHISHPNLQSKTPTVRIKQPCSISLTCTLIICSLFSPVHSFDNTGTSWNFDRLVCMGWIPLRPKMHFAYLFPRNSVQWCLGELFLPCWQSNGSAASQLPVQDMVLYPWHDIYFTHQAGSDVPDLIMADGRKSSSWTAEGMFYMELTTTDTVRR